MIKLIATCVTIVTFSVTSLACLNETHVLLNGKQIHGDRFTADEMTPTGKDFAKLRDEYTIELKKLDSLWKATKNIEYYSDYGVVLVYLGRYAEAKDIFQEIEKTAPGRYATAANLGTVYELLGDNIQALHWIKKAVKIDPTSHDNSEWLHVKILEANIKGDSYVTSDFLIETNFGNDVKPASSLDSLALLKLQEALFYQLNERVSFIKPKDKIVALLLFELGNVYALTADITMSVRLYDMAKEYGYSSEVFEKRYTLFKSMHKNLSHVLPESDESITYQPPILTEADTENNYMTLGISLFCILAIVGWNAIRHHRNN